MRVGLRCALRGGLLAGLLLTGLAGCERFVLVRGQVTDIAGESLPGVAVTIKNTDRHVITNVLGQYALPAPPGAQRLRFSKTGYTPAELPLLVPGAGPVDAGALIRMWPLPESQGVYLFENFRYRTLARTEPTRYIDPDTGKPIFGTTKDIDVYTTDAMPMLLAYRLYNYDLAVHRIEQRQLADSQSPEGKQRWTVWAPVERIPTLPESIDEPDQLLIKVSFATPLKLGAYAVHWGALEGHISTHRRIFLFQLVEELPAEAPVPDELLVEGEAPVPEALPSTSGSSVDVAPPADDSPGYDDLSG